MCPWDLVLLIFVIKLLVDSTVVVSDLFLHIPGTAPYGHNQNGRMFLRGQESTVTRLTCPRGSPVYRSPQDICAFWLVDLQTGYTPLPLVLTLCPKEDGRPVRYVIVL